MDVSPFTIAVPQADIDDLRARIARTRWPGEVAESGWRYGANLAFMQDIVGYWGRDYDWRQHEAALNAFPQFKATVDGVGIHFVHVKGKGPNPMPLVLTHGWPGSFWELLKTVGPLTDPAAHGGDERDAFDVVVPSLPGFGFSDIPSRPGVNQKWTARAWVDLMRGLGYERFAAQGGDWGAYITGWLAYAHAPAVIGAHMNMVLMVPPGDLDRATPEEREWYESDRKRVAEETGYYAVQSTRPQTLGYGLTDSPAGQAAWIIEKWRAWSDCDGDPLRSYTRDELLTNVSIYWFTRTGNSGGRYYYEFQRDPLVIPAGERAEAPCGFAVFPREIVRVPRAWTEEKYNVRYWRAFPKGGHFAAAEVPELLVESIREYFRELR